MLNFDLGYNIGDIVDVDLGSNDYYSNFKITDIITRSVPSWITNDEYDTIGEYYVAYLNRKISDDISGDTGVWVGYLRLNIRTIRRKKLDKLWGCASIVTEINKGV